METSLYNHLKNVNPKARAEICDGGKNINNRIDIALRKYKPLNNIFLVYLSPG